MRTHVVVGAGAIGRGIAARLTEHGDRVVLASRSGVPEPPPGVEGAQVDAKDGAAVARLARGADTLVNAMNPAQYHQWLRDWPTMAASMLAAAERTGAGLLTVSNLYGYGPHDGPLTEDLPLAATGDKGGIRASMWRDALEAHNAGRIRACELRASDYFGASARAWTSILNISVIKAAAQGRTVRLLRGDPDAPHSWTYLPDIVQLGSTLARDDRSWGRAWHVPTTAARSPRDVAGDVNEIAGAGSSRVTVIPRVARLALRVMPLFRELDETEYQFDRPFVLDSSAAEQTFGLAPTAWKTALVETIDGLVPGSSAPVA
jgi:nucleoside-diphosphate-sugar epimerase